MSNSACLGIKPHFVPCDGIDERFDHFEEDVHKPRYIGNQCEAKALWIMILENVEHL